MITSAVFKKFKKNSNFVVMKKSTNNSSLLGRAKSLVPRSKLRWRIEITNENTLAKVARLRLTGIKAHIFVLAVIASIVSLVVVFFTFTPVGRWIWGEKTLRDQYIDLSMRLDSINAVASVNENYMANIAAILSDSLQADTIPILVQSATTDTLIGAGEAEKRFVEQFESDRRFNLSVLAPIAAEGMIFESPVARVGEGGPVMAVYRGTVVGVYVGPDGLYDITIQHPNDFISTYSGLDNVYVAKGAKVVAGQRLGSSDNEAVFELWRGGVALDPAKYIQFPIPTTIAK